MFYNNSISYTSLCFHLKMRKQGREMSSKPSRFTEERLSSSADSALDPAGGHHAVPQTEAKMLTSVLHSVRVTPSRGVHCAVGVE